MTTPNESPDVPDLTTGLPTDVPAEANEADALEQAEPASRTSSSDGLTAAERQLRDNPVEEANPADVEEQDIVVGDDEDDERR